MEKKVSASLIMMLWCVLHALIVDASQKVHVPEIDCSAEANLLFCVYVLYREQNCYLTYPW